MSVQKPVRILYQSRNKTTGLTDVKAEVYLNGVSKAVGVSALLLTEVDATNSPGIYELLISGATLTGYGVAAGSYNALEGMIDSVTAPLSAPFKVELTVANGDDLDSAVALVKADTAAIKLDLETGASDLANILIAVQAIQNNAGFSIPVPEQLVKPATGSSTYRIPFTVYNEKNALIDPDTSSVVITLVNSAGTDRGAYMTGYSAGSAPAVRDSLGQYHIDLAILSSAVEEELIFTFSYAIATVATARKSTTMVANNVTADGFALQSTLTATQTTVNASNTLLTDATVGLTAANTLQNLIKTQTDKIADATIGLSAIKTAINGVQTTTTAIEGTGFTGGTDDLHALSVFLRTYLFTGGRAV